MDDTLLFIPPCCVAKKLPQAIMQAPRRALTFYTHGDVIMESFYRAISYMIVDPHVFVLSMPIVSPETAAFLMQCFERGWITELVLSTSRDATALLHRYLSDYQDRILYACSDDVSDLSSHMVLYNGKQSLSISGPMLGQPCDTRLVAYTMLFQPRHDADSSADYGSPLLNILLPDILRHRKAVKRNHIRVDSEPLTRFLTMELPSISG